jgi:hypothetical protein
MIFHCRRHLYFPLPLLLNLQNLRLPFIDVSYKSLSQISTMLTAEEKTTSLVIPKEIKSLESVLFLMNQYLPLYTSCKSADKIIVLLQTDSVY